MLIYTLLLFFCKSIASKNSVTVTLSLSKVIQENNVACLYTHKHKYKPSKIVYTSGGETQNEGSSFIPKYLFNRFEGLQAQAHGTCDEF